MKILFALLGAAVCYLLQLLCYRRFWNRGLSVSLSLSSEEAREGESAALIEVIENRNFLPLNMLKVKFCISRTFFFHNQENSNVSDHYYRCDVFSVMPWQKITRELPFVCTKRGYYQFGGFDTIGSNLFLTESYIKTEKCRLEFYVYPKYKEYGVLIRRVRQISGELAAKQRYIEDPFAFRGIREYQSSDSMKSINWKSSAKTGQLMVNLYDSTSSKSVRLFLNLEDEFAVENYFLKEEAIRIAASLSLLLLQSGIAVSLYSNGKDIVDQSLLSVPTGSGKDHIKTINKKLARLDLSQKPSDFVGLYQRELEEDRNPNYPIIISSCQHSEFTELLLRVQKTGRDFLWICPLERGMKAAIPDGLSRYVEKLEFLPE